MAVEDDIRALVRRAETTGFERGKAEAAEDAFRSRDAAVILRAQADALVSSAEALAAVKPASRVLANAAVELRAAADELLAPAEPAAAEEG